jgi:nucleoside-diphosphate-sugar epimerase
VVLALHHANHLLGPAFHFLQDETVTLATKKTIIVTGAAGLVGQNLVARLKRDPANHIVGIDKHPANTALLRQLHPDIEVIETDLAEKGTWMARIKGAHAIVLNQAQIGGLVLEEFKRNNVVATQNVLASLDQADDPYIVHISSSVIRSMADDFYTQTKTEQEHIVSQCGFRHVSLRPTLMFGWFDRKHLGWLRRFMDRSPVFPIPGDGAFLRQPLYVGDLVAIIESCLVSQAEGVHDISGREVVTYGNLIRQIHSIVQPKARILPIPYSVFWGLLWLYARLNSNPPFTTSQLEALVIPETFPITDWPSDFGVRQTPLNEALTETFLDPQYSQIVLEF